MGLRLALCYLITLAVWLEGFLDSPVPGRTSGVRFTTIRVNTQPHRPTPRRVRRVSQPPNYTCKVPTADMAGGRTRKLLSRSHETDEKEIKDFEPTNAANNNITNHFATAGHTKANGFTPVTPTRRRVKKSLDTPKSR